MLISFFFNDTATTEIYTLSLHDALPIYRAEGGTRVGTLVVAVLHQRHRGARAVTDRKSTRLNSSHVEISYAVFCLKKKNRRDQPAAALRDRLPGRRGRKRRNDESV